MIRGLVSATFIGSAFVLLLGNNAWAASSRDEISRSDYCVTSNVSPPSAGTVSLRPRGSCFPQGTSIVLTATSGTTGWLFSHWSGDVSIPTNPLAVVVDHNFNLTANFVETGSICKPTLLANLATDGAADVAVFAGYAYVADGAGGLKIVNVSNPRVPVKKGSFATTSEAEGVAVAGNLVYVAAGAQGLLIIDVTNPAAPVLKGSYNTPGSANRVAIVGNLAYVADYFSGLLILDVSNPASPVKKGSYSTPSAAKDVAVSGGLAYVAGFGAGLQIIDVSNPAAPKLKGSLDTPGYAEGVGVSGTTVAIADFSSGLQVIDASDPTKPILRSNYPTQSLTYTVKFSNNVAFIADFSSVRILDLTDPAHPAVRGALDTPGIAYSLAVLDGKIYVADDYRGLTIIDAPSCDAAFPIHCLATSVHPEGTGWLDVEPEGQCFNEGTSIVLTGRPASTAYQFLGWSGDLTGVDGRVITKMTAPKTVQANFGDSQAACRPITTGFLPIEGGATNVAIAGGIAYVAGAKGFVAVDVSNPSAPLSLGRLSRTSAPRQFVVSRGLAFVADAYDGLNILDVSNPASPHTEGHYATNTAPANYPAEAVAVKDDLAFLAVNANGLFVIDVAKPASPSLIVKYDTPGIASGVATSGSLVFVADGTKGLLILDVTSPINPVLRASLNTIVAYDVAVRGTIAYVAGGSSDGLQVVDVSNPDKPVVIGRAGSMNIPYVITIAGRTVALPTGRSLELFDLSTPSIPHPTGYWAGAKEIEGAALANNYGYSADSTGLHIIDLSTCWAAGNVPAPAFDWTPISPTAGESVVFTDASTGAPSSWSWVFGSVARSSAQSPTVVFPTAGTYSVTLDATNEDGTGRIVKEITVRPAGTPPSAQFDWSPSGPAVGQAVQFTDQSSGSVESRVWSFGDGTFGTSAGPSNTFARPGSYNVTLTVGNAFGTTSSTRTVIVSHPANLGFDAKLVLPSQARNAGSGTSYYRTSFWITNSGSGETRVRLRYLPSAGYGMGGAVSARELTILPRQSLAYRDVLTELFGATSDTSGVIIVDVAKGDAVPHATSRTYNDDPSGTYGQYIPAVPLDGVMPAEAWLHGLGGDTANRTNVGVVNLSTTQIQATITVWDANNKMVGIPVQRTVDPSTAVQVNKVNLVATIPTLSLFSAKVTATGPFFAYASKADMITSDPIFIPGDLTPKMTQWIDGVSHMSGVGGTFYKSNLLLTNLGTIPVTAEIAFTERKTTSPLVTKSVTLGAGESKYWAEAVKDITELDLKSGMFRITSPAAITAWARTYNTVMLNGKPGTFGQFIPAFDLTNLIDVKGVIFQGLSQAKDDSSGFRTNMGLINTSGASVTGGVTVFRKEGTVAGRKDYPVAAGQPILVNKILADVLGAGAVINDAYLRIVPSAAGALYTWASMVDNKSTDPTFVRPLAAAATGPVETSPPTNPTTINAWPSPEKKTALVSGQVYPYQNPYFEWTGATDSDSDIAGYYVYFGTSATADPVLLGSYQRFAACQSSIELQSGTSYNLRIRAVDLFGNVGSTSAASYIYTFDSMPPENRTPIDFISSGAAIAWSRTVSLALAATDDVSVVGYYLSESATPPLPSAGGWWSVSATKSYSANGTFILSGGNGPKTVYVWFKDKAGNISNVMSDSIMLTVPEYNLSGTWVGTLSSSQVPGGSSVTIYIVQKGYGLSGPYSTGTGASGNLLGTLTGNTITFTLTQTTPSCTGSFSGTGTVSSTVISFTYTGNDCLGKHNNGQGRVTKQ